MRAWQLPKRPWQDFRWWVAVLLFGLLLAVTLTGETQAITKWSVDVANLVLQGLGVFKASEWVVTIRRERKS